MGLFQLCGKSCMRRTLDSSLRSASFGMTDAMMVHSEYLMRVVIGTTKHDRGSRGDSRIASTGDRARVVFRGMKDCGGALGRGGGRRQTDEIADI